VITDEGPVRAAGCVVWRPHPDKPKKNQILLIHRPHRLDWSHPKGKLDLGETDLECALREVKEETGFEGKVGSELPTVAYVDHKGRSKTVRYWLLKYECGEFEPNDEVDEILWTSPSKAAEILTYAHDVELLDHL
jgi:8-oxo-dGTP diphosphatase